MFWTALSVALVAALVPVDQLPTGSVWDKAQHAGAFAVLTALALWAYGTRAWRRVALGLLALGGLIEVLQAMPVIHRDAELMDWVADAVGVGATLSLSYLWHQIKKPA